MDKYEIRIDGLMPPEYGRIWPCGCIEEIFSCEESDKLWLALKIAAANRDKSEFCPMLEESYLKADYNFMYHLSKFNFIPTLQNDYLGIVSRGVQSLFEMRL